MSIEMFTEFASRIAWATDGAQLDATSIAVTGAWGRGVLSDGEAETLYQQIQALRSNPAGFVRGLGDAAAAVAMTAKRDRRRKSAEARERMRSMAFGGWLPHALASRFTPGELAALSVVGREHVNRGFCSLHIGTIAFRAGVSDRTVRNALHRAAELNLVKRFTGMCNSKTRLAGKVLIVSREWLAWLAKRAPAQGGKMTPPCPNPSIRRSSGGGGAAPETSVAGRQTGNRDVAAGAGMPLGRPWRRSEVPKGLSGCSRPAAAPLCGSGV